MTAEELIELMRSRPCSINIKRYREEMKGLATLRNEQQTFKNISHATIQKQRDMLSVTIKPQVSTQIAFKHRLLNSYVGMYHERLCLKRSKKESALTVDFDQLKKLTHATEHAGFDPYSNYVKNREEEFEKKKHERELAVNNRFKRDQYDQEL